MKLILNNILAHELLESVFAKEVFKIEEELVSFLVLHLTLRFLRVLTFWNFGFESTI